MISRKPPVQRAFTGLVGREEPSPAAPPPPKVKSKSALRAERWRNQQKTSNPKFNEEERLRKEQERAETARLDEIEAVRTAKEPPLTVMDESGKTVRVITGGYDPDEIARMSDNQQQSSESGGRKVKPKGAGPGADESGLKEYDFQFARAAFKRVRTPKEVRAMKDFIYSNVEKYSFKSHLTICSHCKGEISPFPVNVPLLAFQHFHDAHLNLFEAMMAKVRKAGEKPACREDHDGMVKRFGNGNSPLQCRRCKKILWRPDADGGDDEGAADDGGEGGGGSVRTNLGTAEEAASA